MAATTTLSPKTYLNGWFVPNDIDGFFGLFVDNLCQLIVIVGLCPALAGLPLNLVVGRILPGIAVSLVAGNLFYAWQARRLEKETGKPVTALPFGVNTISLFAFIFLILAPVYHATNDADLAWKVSLAAGFFGGVVEIVASFFGAWVRRHTPRAALLSTLAGAAITFISMGFVFQIFNSPLVALLPALLVLVGYAGQIRWPGGISTGLLAVIVGLASLWAMRLTGHSPIPPLPTDALSFHLPVPMVGQIFALLTSKLVWGYAAVFLPMAVINVIGSLQNLESAEAAGDRFDTRSSLLVNGASAILGVCFGNPFAPTIYIGHPGWKALGARSGYSVLNAVAVTLVCLTGAMPFVLWFMPIEVTLGILLWIGIIITAQSFQETPKSHAPAVAIGFIPALAAWGELLIETTLGKTGHTLGETAASFSPQIYLYGMLSLAQGFMFTSILLSAIMANVIDRRWRAAGVWCLVAALASACGIIHGFVFTPMSYGPALFQWTGFGGAIPSGADFALVYLLAAVGLFATAAAKIAEPVEGPGKNAP